MNPRSRSTSSCAPCATAGPEPRLVTLPDDAEYLRIVPELDICEIAKLPSGHGRGQRRRA